MAAKTVHPYLVAVDTCVLLDLANHFKPAWNAIRSIRKLHPSSQFIVTATVIQECAAHIHSKYPEKSRLSKEALQNLRTWGFHPMNFIAVGHGIVDSIAHKIIQKNLLPEEERNDSLILSEVALADCNLLLTADSHLLSIPSKSLHDLLEDCDVFPVKIKGYHSF